MLFRARCSADVARLRDGHGVRRRSVKLGDETRQYVIGREWTEIEVEGEKVPIEIWEDQHLEVAIVEPPKPVKVEAPKAPPKSDDEGEEAEGGEVEVSDEVATDEEEASGTDLDPLDDLTAKELKARADELGLPTYGSKADLKDRISGALDPPESGE